MVYACFLPENSYLMVKSHKNSSIAEQMMKNELEIGLDQRGEVTSFRRLGKEFASSRTTTVFQVQLRDMVGNPVQLAGNSFGQVTVRKTADGYA